MGQRANLILVEGEDYELYYCHWCANGLDRDLFWGPEHAVSFIRQQKRMGEEGWLDDIWAEGGAVVDPGKKVLLLFGGESVRFDVPLRRIYMELLRAVWNGREVRWAYEGIADLADYVGYPRERVLSKEVEDPFTDLDLPEKRDWTDTMGSVAFEEGALRFFPLQAEAPNYLFSGLPLTDIARKERGVERFDLDEWTPESLTSGFHIDVSRRSVEFWTASEQPGIEARLKRCWPGWDVLWHQDRFEFQIERAGGLLRLPVKPRAEMEERVRRILLAEDGWSPSDTLTAFLEQHASPEGKVEFNPLMFQYDRLSLPLPERERILREAFASLQRNREEA
jgi:hypothetical protein